MKPVILFTFKDRQIWRICFVAISLLLAFLIADSVFADPKKGKTVISDLKKEPAAQAAAIDNDLQVGDLVYTNRAYTWVTIPEDFLGMPLVVPPNSWDQDPDIKITFKIDRDSWIWVLYPYDPPRDTRLWLTENFEQIMDENTNKPQYIFEGDFVAAVGRNYFFSGWRSVEPFIEVDTVEIGSTGEYVYGGIVAESIFDPNMPVEAKGKLAAIWGNLKED